MAKTVGSGECYDRYGAVADEADHAMAVLGAGLSDAYSGEDERGAG